MPNTIIVDEADGFEDTLRQQLAAGVTAQQCREAVKLAAQLGRYTRRVSADDLRSALEDLANVLRATVQASKRQAHPDATRIAVVDNAELLGALARAAAVSERTLTVLQIQVTEGDEAVDRLSDILDDVLRLHRHYAESRKDPASLAWVEANGIFAGPTLVGGPLKAAVSRSRIVLTSGTLAPDGDFTVLRHLYGLRQIPTFHVPSPYAYERLMRYALVSPEDDVPSPALFRDPSTRDPLYNAWTPIIKNLLQAVGGRSLILFTSKADLRAMHDRLNDLRLPFRLFSEDLRSVGDLADEFRRDETSVLLSTSAWQGLDVPGRALLSVIVTKLPYPVPDDPLFVAHRRLLQDAGLLDGEIFATRWMLHRLAQGVGRLIRHEEDRGLVAILDVRSRERWDLLQPALPQAPICTLGEASRFLSTIARS